MAALGPVLQHVSSAGFAPPPEGATFSSCDGPLETEQGWRVYQSHEAPRIRAEIQSQAHVASKPRQFPLHPMVLPSHLPTDPQMPVQTPDVKAAGNLPSSGRASWSLRAWSWSRADCFQTGSTLTSHIALSK